jgi:hypothetical protein
MKGSLRVMSKLSGAIQKAEKKAVRASEAFLN